MTTGKWLMFMLIPLVLGVNFSPLLRGMAGYSPEIDPETEKSILNATIQIRMFRRVDANGKFIMAQGLGTLVQNNHEIQIVTHNHWGEMLQKAEFVRFQDANDHMLLETSGFEFWKLIITQDAGTLLLKAPPGLVAAGKDLNFARLGSSRLVNSGDKVLLVHQENGDTGKVIIMQGVVDGSDIYQQLPVFKLHTLDGQSIICGDSGGGVWLEGKLVGNMWGRETVQQSQGGNLSTLFQPVLNVKEVGYVAQLPSVLGGRDGLLR